MGIGVSIFLLVLGAILTWAIDWSVAGIDINVVGAILMIAGVGGLTLFFYFWNRQRTPEAVASVRQRQAPAQPRTYDDPTPPPATVTTVTPQPATVTAVTPQLPPPAHATTVSATAAVPVPSR